MKTTSHQSTGTKKVRLAKALILASPHKGCTAATIASNDTNLFGVLGIFGEPIIFDILEKSERDIFRIHSKDWLLTPSAEVATSIANRANSILPVAKVVAKGNELGIFAHEFVEKTDIPSEANLMRLLDDVLIAMVLISKQLEDFKEKSALSKELPSCSEPILN